MSNNSNLQHAKNAKNDEFYTLLEDIEQEIATHIECNPHTFRDKTVLLPCDDPQWSSFTYYFAHHFDELGLKKLISTSKASSGAQQLGFHNPIIDTPLLSEDDVLEYYADDSRGRKYVLERTGDSATDIGTAQLSQLNEDGDFRSQEVTVLRDEADIIITNPPFSLIKDFIPWIIEGNKHFIIVAPLNSVKYKNIFPHFKSGKMWCGSRGFSGMHFAIPNSAPQKKQHVIRNGMRCEHLGMAGWITNLPHSNYPPQKMPLMTMEENLRYTSRIKNNPLSYRRYDNYDAIEVPWSRGIPSDYDGVMGVPVSFIDKINPEQFDLIGANGMTEDWVGGHKEGTPTGCSIEGKAVYGRLFVILR